MVFTT